ncbi:NrfD/PsrC family molybdoenzyme membrane anchor subunit [Streptomyces griseoincarnatus]
MAPIEHAQPWGTLLAVYFTLIGIPSGLTLIVWWHRNRYPTAALALDWRAAWATLGMLAAAGLLLTIDLGRPERFHLMLTEFGNWDSPISLGAKIIAVKTFLIAVALYLLWRRHAASHDTPAQARGMTARIDTSVAWLLGASSIALAIYPVAVLARTWVSPLAATSNSSLLFLITSLLMGCATVLILDAWSPNAAEQQHGLNKITLVLLMAHTVTLLFAAASISGGPAKKSLDTVLTGEHAPLFYTCVIGVGVFLPAAALALAGHRRWVRLLAAGGLLAGTAAIRYLMFTA